MRRFLLVTAAVSVLSLLVARVAALGASLEANEPFPWLFGWQETQGAMLGMALVLVAGAAPARWGMIAERLALAAAGRTGWIAVFSTVVLAILCLVVYEARPLTGADEYLPVFQAEIFAAGEITGRWPPELLPWLRPTRLGQVFYGVGAGGEVVSAYWPGFALLLTPFVPHGGAWLVNPLLAGGSLAMIGTLARRLYPGAPAAPGWALLLTLASPTFVLHAISFYSMNAHLFANLLFALLLSRGSRIAAWAAGTVGSIALALHNPLPHLLFALPWLGWTLYATSRRRLLLPLLAGYLPLTLLLVIGWPLVWASLAHGTDAPQLLTMPLVVPGPELLWIRLLEILRLFGWGVPGLPLLAVWGAVLAWRRSLPVRGELCGLLVASAVSTLGGYFLLAVDQGWGWGYRHAHYAFAVLPLLGTAPLLWRPPHARLAMVGTLLVGSLLAGNALRLWQASLVIEQDRRTRVPYPTTAPAVCFVGPSFNLDQLRNDPFLRDPVLMLGSRGRALDADLLARRFPSSSHRLPGPAGVECWRVALRDLELLRQPSREVAAP